MTHHRAETAAQLLSDRGSYAAHAAFLMRARLGQIRFSAKVIRAIAWFRIGEEIIRFVQRRSIGRAIFEGTLGFHRVFPTLAEAEKAVLPYANHGHENPYNAELHLALNNRPRPSDYAAIFHLAPEIADAKRIFDVGGNVGNLYYCYSEYLKFRKDLIWTVYDLPRNIQHGAALAQERNARNLHFADRWDEASGCDILVASGSLHYFETPLSQLIADLPQKPRSILINRTPLTDGPPVAVVQDAGQFLVGCMLYNRQMLICELERIGYVLVDMWQAIELSLIVPGSPDHKIGAYSGLWFKLEA